MQIPQTNLTPSPFHARKKQKEFLDIRGLCQQIHDLLALCLRHIPQPGQFRIIRHRLRLNQTVEVDRQRYQLRDTPEDGVIEDLIMLLIVASGNDRDSGLRVKTHMPDKQQGLPQKHRCPVRRQLCWR